MSLYSILFSLVLTFNLPFSLLSQNSTPTLWDSLEEPDIRDTSEFEYLFSKDTPQQKKKPLSETYEKKNMVKKVLPGYSNHNYITVFCPNGVSLCATGLLSLCFQKNVLEGFESQMTSRSQYFEKSVLTILVILSEFSNYFLNLNFFPAINSIKKKKKTNLMKSGL